MPGGDPARGALATALALIPFLAIAALHWFEPHGRLAGDYAQYLLHAQAMAEGRPYTDIGYIYTDFDPVVGPRAYPPGLPLLLLPFFLVGASTVWMRLVLLGLGIAALVMAGRYFAARGPGWIGLGVVAFTGVSLEFVHNAVAIGTSVAFTAAAWAVILIGERAEWGWRRVVALSVLGAAAVLLRTSGVALAPAFALLTVVRWRTLGAKPLIPAGAAVAAFVLTDAVLPVAASYADQMDLSVTGVASQVWAGIVAYRLAVADVMLYPFASELLNDGYHVVGLGLVVVGLVAWLRSRPDAPLLVAFTVSYVCLLLPFPATVTRYLFPVFPVVVFGLLNGLRVGLERVTTLEGARSQAGALACVALLAALAPHTHPPDVGAAGHPDGQSLFEYLRGEADDDEVRAAFYKPRVLSWEADIPAMVTFDASPPEILAELGHQGITHVVLGDLGLDLTANAAFGAAIRLHPGSFPMTYRNASFTVHRFRGPPER